MKIKNILKDYFLILKTIFSIILQIFVPLFIFGIIGWYGFGIFTNDLDFKFLGCLITIIFFGVPLSQALYNNL